MCNIYICVVCVNCVYIHNLALLTSNPALPSAHPPPGPPCTDAARTARTAAGLAAAHQQMQKQPSLHHAQHSLPLLRRTPTLPPAPPVQQPPLPQLLDHYPPEWQHLHLVSAAAVPTAAWQSCSGAAAVLQKCEVVRQYRPQTYGQHRWAKWRWTAGQLPASRAPWRLPRAPRLQWLRESTRGGAVARLLPHVLPARNCCCRCASPEPRCGRGPAGGAPARGRSCAGGRPCGSEHK